MHIWTEAGRKEGTKKTEWDHGWVKFPCSLISINLLFKIILVGKHILMFYGRTVCLVLCCHIFSASQVMVAGWALCYYGLHQEGSVLFPKWPHVCPGARPHPLSPNLQSQTRGLHFPPLLAGKEWILEHKDPIRAPRVGREFQVCSILPLR